jgi:hypothetical protein
MTTTSSSSLHKLGIKKVVAASGLTNVASPTGLENQLKKKKKLF